MTAPLVTVIVPAYDSAEFVVEALESCLAQDYPALEVQVVDDCSTDGTYDVVSAFARARSGRTIGLWRNQRNLGAAATRNLAAASARGDYLAFLDSDDSWHPQKTSRQMAALTAGPAADGALAHVQQFLTPGREEELARRFRLPDGAQPGYLPSALLIRRQRFLDIGGFSEEWRAREGLEFFVRAFQSDLNLLMLPETLVRRRIHGDNLGIREKALQRELPRLLKAKLDADRRRAGRGRTGE